MIAELTQEQAKFIIGRAGIPYHAVEKWELREGRLAIRYWKTDHDNKVLTLPDGRKTLSLDTVLNIPDDINELAMT